MLGQSRDILTLLVHTKMLYTAATVAEWTAGYDQLTSTVLLHTPTLQLQSLFLGLNCGSWGDKRMEVIPYSTQSCTVWLNYKGYSL